MRYLYHTKNISRLFKSHLPMLPKGRSIEPFVPKMVKKGDIAKVYCALSSDEVILENASLACLNEGVVEAAVVFSIIDEGICLNRIYLSDDTKKSSHAALAHCLKAAFSFIDELEQDVFIAGDNDTIGFRWLVVDDKVDSKIMDEYLFGMESYEEEDAYDYLGMAEIEYARIMSEKIYSGEI